MADSVEKKIAMEWAGLRLLILGGGAVVAEYHLPALRMLNAIDGVVIVDASARSLDFLSKDNPGVRCVKADFRDYLVENKGRYDAVMIALPNHLHYEAASMALRNGGHVLCEKPLALAARDCLLLADLAQETGKALAVGMTRRLLPSVAALREALRSGLIGALQSVDIEDGAPYAWLSDSGAFFRPENGGVLADMGVHYLDLVEELGGSLTPVSYTDDWRGGVEANCEFQLVCGEKTTVRLALSRTRLLRNSAIFRGEHGELSFAKETFDCCFWRTKRSDGFTGRLQSARAFRNAAWSPTFGSAFAEQLVEFAETIRGKRAPRVTARDAAQTMRLIEWAYQRRTAAGSGSKADRSEGRGRPVVPAGRTVVTGGTGFIGARLVQRLASLGFKEIVVPVRSYRTCAEVARFAVEMPRTNLLEPAAIREMVRGARFVFHLAYGRDGEDAERVTVEGTRNVVEAAIEAGVECVVVLSTMYVFGFADKERMIDERDPYRPVGGGYGGSKAEMERWCLARAATSGATRMVVLNPTCVYGPGGRAYTMLPAELSKEGRFCWIEEGRGAANYTFIENLIDALLLAVSTKAAHGERIIINDGCCSWREFLQPLLFPGDQPRSFTRAELEEMERRERANWKDVVRALGGDRELLDAVSRHPVLGAMKRRLLRWLPGLRSVVVGTNVRKRDHLSGVKPQPGRRPPEWLADLFGPQQGRFCADKAGRILGWKPGVGLRDGQLITRRWLCDAGLLPPTD